MAGMPDNSRSSVLPLSSNSSGQGLLLTSLAMLALGVIMVHAAMTRPVVRDVAWYSRTDMRHTLFAAMSCIVLFTCWRFDYRWLSGHKKLPIVAAIGLIVSVICCLLIFVPGLGQDVGGYVRWLRLGPKQFGIGFQPSELIKFTLPIFLAAWLGKEHVDRRSLLRTFLPAMAVIGLAVGVTVKQDFSTGAVVGLAAMVTLLLAGVPWYYLASLVPVAAVGFYKFVVMDPYRWNRMIAWQYPYSDNPCAYQARESLMAILTGGWAGKGLGRGSVYLGYLPEGSTDFIFSVYCEQLGFIGALLLAGLILLWIWNARKIALRAADRFGYLLAGSLGFLIAMQAVMHIAVALVAAPTTGMGLPFLSAGGTSLLITAGAVAMMISVSARGTADANREASASGALGIPDPVR